MASEKAQQQYNPDPDPEVSLVTASRRYSRSAPDLVAAAYQEEQETAEGRNAPPRQQFRIEEMKSRDFLNVPEKMRIFGSHTPPPPQYSKVSEQLRRIGSSSPTVHRLQCSTFCGGKSCKYENPQKWGIERGVAFDGLFSHWVTNSILAMARPSTVLFQEYHLLEKFKEAGINAVINLQTPGEHAHCGPGQEESGFTYNPEYLMRNDVYFYNYGWPDYGISNVENILDIVKVIDFSCANGKVAIHCHAGLGRTGAAIACYLVYSERISADDAIVRVREKRPDSIQTRGQLESINQFSLHLLSLWTLYPCLSSSLNLSQYLKRQAKLFHGEELQKYKHIPKVIAVLCSRLKELREDELFQYHWYTAAAEEAECDNGQCEEENTTEENWLVVSYSSSELSNDIGESVCYQDDQHLIQSLLGTSPCCQSQSFKDRLTSLKNEMNDQWIWHDLTQEKDPTVLFSLLFTFLFHLKEPVISLKDCSHMDFIEHLSKSQKTVLHTILDTVKTIIPTSHLMTHLLDIAVHLIKFLCHYSSRQVDDSSTNQLLHYIREYFH